MWLRRGKERVANTPMVRAVTSAAPEGQAQVFNTETVTMPRKIVKEQRKGQGVVAEAFFTTTFTGRVQQQQQRREKYSVKEFT